MVGAHLAWRVGAGGRRGASCLRPAAAGAAAVDEDAADEPPVPKHHGKSQIIAMLYIEVFY